MTENYKDLRDALAAGPTPGPWLLDKFHPIITDSAPGSSRVFICKVAINTRNDEGRKNEAYIAAANPETIRALLAERDELERALTLAGKTNKALMDQHHADSKTLRDYAQQRDDLRKERDALREALQKVRPVIAADRQALLDCHGDGNEIPAADKLGTLGLYEYDGALNAIDAALAQHQVGGAQ